MSKCQLFPTQITSALTLACCAKGRMILIILNLSGKIFSFLKRLAFGISHLAQPCIRVSIKQPLLKFATNDLILHMGLFAYNLLRLIGQIALIEPDAPTIKL